MSFASITDAILALKVAGSRKGVSRTAIKGKLGDISAARINIALKKAVAAGKISQTGDSFKVVGKAKAAPKKKPAAKKAAKKPVKKVVKKKATKKKAAPKKKATKKKSTKKKK